MNTKMIDYLWDEGAFHDFVDYHNDHPITARELYNLIKDGQSTFNDLPDFCWGDYLDGNTLPEYTENE